MAKYPTYEEAVETIIEVGKRMFQKNYVVSNDGNITCKISDNVILTTPTGVSKGYMTPEMMIRMTLDGEILDERAYKPSSEVKMHLRVYKENPNVNAVVHAHPPAATSFAVAGIPLDQAILTEGVVMLGVVPVAHYATPSTDEVPNSIAPFCHDYSAVLLANHGALTWGEDLFQAYHRLESLEYYATVTMYTGSIIGKANILSKSQIDALLAIRKNLGIQTGGVPPCVEKATNTEDVISLQNAAEIPHEKEIEAIVLKCVKEVLKKLS